MALLDLGRKYPKINFLLYLKYLERDLERDLDLDFSDPDRDFERDPDFERDLDFERLFLLWPPLLKVQKWVKYSYFAIVMVIKTAFLSNF